MARKTVGRTLVCAECGAEVSKHSLWVDNSGFLCPDCAVMKRVERMRTSNIPILQHRYRRNWSANFAKRILGLPRKVLHLEDRSC